MRTTARHAADATRRAEPAEPPDITVPRLIAAVHIGLIASLVLLVGVRLLGFHFGVAAQFEIVGLMLVWALVVLYWRGRVGRS